MEYLLKSSAIIFIFYACYKLFLQRDTFFESNRWFLLSGLIFASCISFIVIKKYIEYTPININNFAFSSQVNVMTTPIEEVSFNYVPLLYWFYSLGVIFFLGRLCIQLLSLRRILNQGQTKQFESYNLVESKENIAPFSFFNSIVYNPNQFSPSELEHVINHEKAHSKQLHSIDNIIVQLTCVVLWFNPFVWLYKKALLQNLEFIADQKAQYISHCEKSYQTVLLKASVQNQDLALANNFYTSLIKKRIVMLHKSKSKRWNQFKLLIVLPLLALFIMGFNIEEVYIETAETEENAGEENNETIEIIITKKTSDEDLEKIKDELKNKGITFEYKVLDRNSKGEITIINSKFKNDKSSTNYNILKEEGIKPFKFTSSDGNLSVGTIDKNTFVFESENGKTKAQSSNSSSKVIIIEEGDKSTIDIKTLKHKDTLYFKKKNKTYSYSTDDEDTNIFIHDSDEPIFIINGKKVNKSFFEDVDSDDIESVFVIKDKAAIKRYGKEAKNGAVVMRKKSSKEFFNIDEDVIIESKVRLTSDGNSPLIIVDGEIIEEEYLKEIDPNNIDSIEVLKDEAVRVYGGKGKNGAIIVKTIKDRNTSSKTLIDSDVIIYESKEKGPWKIESGVSSVYITSDSGDIETIEFVIGKNSTDTFLEQQKRALKSHGIDAKFSKVRRNNSGEITSIKISLDDNEGRKSTASWKEKTQAIPDIIMGKQGETLLLRAIN